MRIRTALSTRNKPQAPTFKPYIKPLTVWQQGLTSTQFDVDGPPDELEAQDAPATAPYHAVVDLEILP